MLPCKACFGFFVKRWDKSLTIFDSLFIECKRKGVFVFEFDLMAEFLERKLVVHQRKRRNYLN